MSARTSSGSTSLSLVHRLQQHDAEAWERFVHLYAPLIHFWCKRHGLSSADAADAMQEICAAVYRGIDKFQRHKTGSFRAWLRTVSNNKIHDHFRRQAKQAQADGGSLAQQRLNEIPDEQPDDAEHSRQLTALAMRGLESIRPHFDESTWQAFRRTALDGEKTADVAEQLGMTANNVRQARSRVLRRLRAELGELPE